MKWTRSKIQSLIIENTENGYCKSSSIGPVATTMARRMFGDFQKACESVNVNSYSRRPTYTICQVEGCTKKNRSDKTPYCEMHYYRIRRNDSLKVNGSTLSKSNDQCLHCNGETDNNDHYCSERCKSRYLRGNDVYKKCVVCDETFKPLNKGMDNHTCSSNCREIRKRVYNVNHCAKMRVLDSLLYDKLDLKHYFMKPTNVCHICSLPIDMSLKRPDVNSFTIDHVIPLNKGGSHSYQNIKPAHLKCNSRKQGN